MTFDKLAQDSAQEIRDARRTARFTVGLPGSRRPALGGRVVAALSFALVVAVAVPILVWTAGGDDSSNSRLGAAETTVTTASADIATTAVETTVTTASADIVTTAAETRPISDWISYFENADPPILLPPGADWSQFIGTFGTQIKDQETAAMGLAHDARCHWASYWRDAQRNGDEAALASAGAQIMEMVDWPYWPPRTQGDAQAINDRLINALDGPGSGVEWLFNSNVCGHYELTP